MKFVKPGLQTTVQDFGRKGMMDKGVGISGAMDWISMAMANWLVSKPVQSPVMEVTLLGPEIVFENELSIAICGGEFALTLNKKNISQHQTIHVKPGDHLSFGACRRGSRAYLAFAAEAEFETFAQSASTHLMAGFGGYQGRSFQAGDIIPLGQCSVQPVRKIPQDCIIQYHGNYLLRCTAGVESCWFNAQQKQVFLQQHYQVSPQSNRMGIRLMGKPLTDLKKDPLLSGGLLPGSVQITSAGLPIISAVDGQTVGGYPRIGNIISADQPLLGQLKAGDHIGFEMIDRAMAIKILRQKRDKLAFLFE